MKHLKKFWSENLRVFEVLIFASNRELALVSLQVKNPEAKGPRVIRTRLRKPFEDLREEEFAKCLVPAVVFKSVSVIVTKRLEKFASLLGRR